MRCHKRSGTWLLAVTVGLAGLTPAGSSAAKETPIFSIPDPAGDDHGGGSLIYPVRPDFQRGELDLRSFSALDRGDGTVFEVTFARPVRKPGRQVIDGLGGQLNSIARLGFFTFNVDIYIDTDRLSGSGNVATLPGRRADVALANAWEKAICLTPRPYEAQQVLRRAMLRDAKWKTREKEGRIDEATSRQLELEVDREASSQVFFPTLVWVTGSSVRFFVPASFLGGIARDNWGYVVAVSAADVTERVDLSTVSAKSEPSPKGMFIIPVGPGRGEGFVGGGNEYDDLQPPLLDIIVPAGSTQAQVLKDYSPAVGRAAQLPAVVPAASH